MTPAEQLKAAEDHAREIAVRDSNVVNNLMKFGEGRSWMYDFLEACHIGMTPFSTDPIIMAHNCGEMNIGMRVWSQLQDYCPDQYILMMQERKILNERRAQRSATADPDTDATEPES